MTRISTKVLQKVVEELNDFLDITPRISTKSTDEVLREKILEAAGLLVVDGKVNEMLELSKTTQKVIAVLREYAEMEEEEVPEDKPVTQTKQAPKGTTVKKGTGVIATIVKCLEDSGKSGISQEEVLKVLCKNFPERSPESMRKTIQVQLPGRISKERFPVVKLKGGLYAKK